MKKFIVSVVFSVSLIGAFPSAFAAAGSLDPTFGNDGIVETNFGSNDNNFQYPTFGNDGTVTTQVGLLSGVGKVLLQTNGEIVAVGITHVTTGSTTEDLAIARYLAK